jgi:AcrR family transcriptional regulator
LAIQERAARTREAILLAAAADFDRYGYQGTSLARIRAAAGISTGALTFHFPTKDSLADTIQQRGHERTRQAVGHLASAPMPALRAVVSLTLALAGLLERDVTVRAAARLSRERPQACAAWSTAWTPTACELAQRAAEALPREGSAATVIALTRHLVAGVEVHLRCSAWQAASAPDGLSPRAQLEQVWDLLLRGLDLLK